MSRSFRIRCNIQGLARASFSLLCLPAFAIVLAGNPAKAAQGAPSVASGFAPRFAIADFDGDRKPDLATVQVVREAALDSYYFVRLQLSAGEESAIGIAGPQGGLGLEARDVNGDDAMDLVVTTATDSHFVAILLNDGHGKFTLAKAGVFPSIESNERIRLVAARDLAEECAVLQFTWSTFGIEALPDAGRDLERHSRFSFAGADNADLPHVWRGTSGRSPPVAVIHP